MAKGIKAGLEAQAKGGKHKVARCPTLQVRYCLGGFGVDGRGCVGPGPAIEIASRLLHDEEWWLAIHAADLVGEIGAEAGEAAARLRELLRHEDEQV